MVEFETKQEVMNPAMQKLQKLREQKELETKQNQLALVPNRIMILMDCSGSMNLFWSGSERISAAKSAMDQIIAASNSKETSYGLITFQSFSQLIHPMGTGYAKFLGTSFNPSGGTSLGNGLELSKTENPNRLIVLTDGEVYDTFACLELAKGYFAPRSIKIDTIAIGDANDQFLKQLSELTGGKFFRANTPEELNKVFVQLEPKNYLQLEHKS